MIFARYIGVSDNRFTSGRLYTAKPEIDSAETVNFDSLDVIGDSGDCFRINPDLGLFEYLDEVYAVISSKIDGLKVGCVAVLYDIADDGCSFGVKGTGGYRNSSSFVILDRTNVFPGLSVLDHQTNRWTKVRRVDERLWIAAGDVDSFRSPLDFTFAVADGDILTEPIVTCVSACGASLTKDKLYVIRGIERGGMVRVEDDNGNELSFMNCRFK